MVPRLLALAASVALSRAASCEEGGCEADESTLLATRATSRQGRRALSLREEPVLDGVNYVGQEGLWCVGINAAGFDLDPTSGRFGNFIVPSQTQLRYFRERGSNCFRLPVSWERLQTDPNTDVLDLLPGVNETVNFITNELEAYVIIDPHNNDQGLSFNGSDANRSQFVNLWRAISASEWGQRRRVLFGLYNEPRRGFENGRGNFFDEASFDKDGEQIRAWTNWTQEAIDVIRENRAENVILVPGLRFSSCRDWTGAFFWGPPLNGSECSGNTYLASLTDPLQKVVYDVHQYFNAEFSGTSTGCSGHTDNIFAPGSPGADGFLPVTIEWARRFNKKLMLTETASFPANDGTNAECQRLMGNYLQTMHDSGVFLGYHVWQFGCADCLGDQYTLRPYNLDWYRYECFGGSITAPDFPPPPTFEPTPAPTAAPTVAPTPLPTAAPTPAPSMLPRWIFIPGHECSEPERWVLKQFREGTGSSVCLAACWLQKRCAGISVEREEGRCFTFRNHAPQKNRCSFSKRYDTFFKVP